MLFTQAFRSPSFSLRLALTVYLGAAAFGSDLADAQTIEYQVTRINPAPNAYSTVPVGMNQHGDVVGWSQFFDGSPNLQAWVYRDGVGLSYLPAPPGLSRWAAVDINDSGVIAGDGGYDGGQAWRWDGSTHTLLGTLPGDNVSTASRINNHDVVAMTSRDGNSFLKPASATISQPGQPLQQILLDALATHLNDNGQLCGYSNLKAFRYNPTSGIDMIGPLGTKPLTWASSLNIHGDVVGEAAASNGNGHVPFLYTDQGGIQEIGNFGGSAGASDINDHQTVIGNFSSNKPWIWSAVDGVRFLNGLVDPAEKLGILSAIRINNAGQILCEATDQLVGGFVAVILTPTVSAAWSDLGFSLAGAAGAPTLVGTGTLIGGQPISLTVENAAPSATTLLMAGFQRIDTPFFGGTLVPSFTPPSGALLFLSTNASGAFSQNANWPSGLPSGATLYAQAWIVDAGGPAGLAATNAVAGLLP